MRVNKRLAGTIARDPSLPLVDQDDTPVGASPSARAEPHAGTALHRLGAGLPHAPKPCRPEYNEGPQATSTTQPQSKDPLPARSPISFPPMVYQDNAKLSGYCLVKSE